MEYYLVSWLYLYIYECNDLKPLFAITVLVYEVQQKLLSSPFDLSPQGTVYQTNDDLESLEFVEMNWFKVLIGNALG